MMMKLALRMLRKARRDLSKLIPQRIHTKSGKVQTYWVRASKEDSSGTRQKQPEAKSEKPVAAEQPEPAKPPQPLSRPMKPVGVDPFKRPYVVLVGYVIEHPSARGREADTIVVHIPKEDIKLMFKYRGPVMPRLLDDPAGMYKVNKDAFEPYYGMPWNIGKIKRARYKLFEPGTEEGIRENGFELRVKLPPELRERTGGIHAD